MLALITKKTSLWQTMIRKRRMQYTITQLRVLFYTALASKTWNIFFCLARTPENVKSASVKKAIKILNILRTIEAKDVVKGNSKMDNMILQEIVKL